MNQQYDWLSVVLLYLPTSYFSEYGKIFSKTIGFVFKIGGSLPSKTILSLKES